MRDALPDLSVYTTAAREMAARASAETLPRFRQGGAVENKLANDYDPVTEADKEGERVIRELISNRFPDHGILGEEFDEVTGTSGFRWILDPVDGTRAFVCGVPSWTTLIALEFEGRPVMGLISQPCLNELFLGSGAHATLNAPSGSQALQVSRCTDLSEARITTSDPRHKAYFTATEADAFAALEDQCRLARFSLDAYGYALLAAGQFDLVVEAGLQWHDAAALIPVIEGAGGIVRDWRGQKIDQPWDKKPGHRGQIIAAASPDLLGAALPYLSSAAV